nr:hypothetical protein [Pectinatus frisingensis]
MKYKKLGMAFCIGLNEEAHYGRRRSMKEILRK